MDFNTHELVNDWIDAHRLLKIPDGLIVFNPSKGRWCKCEEYELIFKINNLLNNTFDIHKRTYFDIKNMIKKMFFKPEEEMKNIGINCNMEDEDLIKELYPWMSE
jgi:hypothetical protein